MPFALVMPIDETVACRITMLWDILAERGTNGQPRFSDEQLRLNCRPHVTLAAIDDTADSDLLVEMLRSIVSSWTPLRIYFDSIVVLPRKPVVPMLVRPIVTTEFLKLNRDVCDTLPSDLIKPYHRPKVWQPHVTLARDIPRDKSGDALVAILDRWTGFGTILNHVTLVHFRHEGRDWHVRELWRTQL